MIIKNNANKECIIFIFIILLILTPKIKPKKDKKIILANNKKSTFNTLLFRSENIANIEFKKININEACAACFTLNFWNKINTGTIKNPPPTPNKPVKLPTKNAWIIKGKFINLPLLVGEFGKLNNMLSPEKNKKNIKTSIKIFSEINSNKKFLEKQTPKMDAMAKIKTDLILKILKFFVNKMPKNDVKKIMINE